MTIDLPENLQHLAQIPIEQLGLSNKALYVLKWHGITNILTCIVFFYWEAHETDTSMIFDWSHRWHVFMYDEVEPKMKEHGYWSFVEDAETWHVIQQQVLGIDTSMVVWWQGQDQDLYDVPLEKLGLSDDVYETMPRYYRSVGHCIDYFVTILNRYPRSRIGREGLYGPSATSHRHKDSMIAMFEEVQPKLIELGYWKFVEDNVD